jgi:hypothetical protein
MARPPTPVASRGQALASIFEEDRPKDLAGRGPDLEAIVHVRPSEVGKGPIRVSVADVLETERGPVRRMRDRNDPPGTLQLNLPADLPEMVRLRLRGQGGSGRSAHGDLILTVVIQEDAAVAQVETITAGMRMSVVALWVLAFLGAALGVAWLGAL